MTKININVSPIVKTLIVLDLLLFLALAVLKDFIWVLNSQVAFFSSSLIVLASFYSYKKNIEKRVANLQISDKDNLVDEIDEIDKIDDPYDLYSEDIVIESKQELSQEEIKDILKEEKSKLKKDSFKNTLFSAGGFLSIYRFLSYGILVFGFFALNNNHLFIPLAFFLGITIIPVGVVLSRIIKK